MKQQQRRPGRPRKPTSERKIAPSVAGRLSWRPGDPHPLDAMYGEASAAQTHLHAAVDGLMDQLITVQRTLADAEHASQSPDELAGTTDREARAAIRRMFGNKKHSEHLQATMAAIRRIRLAARFEVARVALDLALDLLTEIGPSPEEELMTLITEVSPTHARRQSPVVGALAKRLTEFEAQIHTQRERLVRGTGWFELHYVTHERLNREAIREAKRDNRQLSEEEMFIKRTYGPYLEYRWREGKGPKYTVYLGSGDEEASDADISDTTTAADASRQ